MELEILSYFSEEERNPHDVYQSNKFDYSRATFYRKLDKLKEMGLIDWRVGKARLTEKGLNMLEILNGNYNLDLIPKNSEINNDRVLPSNELKQRFRLYEADELKNRLDKGFIYVDYPTASYILKALLIVVGIEDKGLKTNVEKFKALKQADFKVKLAINHFENSSKQVLVFLDELIKLGKIEALYVGVKNERKALANKKLVEFLQAHNFENERFKLPFVLNWSHRDHINLSPTFRLSACFHSLDYDDCLLHEVNAVQRVEGALINRVDRL
jgi:DNA-binding MarR family transcriptional regulator